MRFEVLTAGFSPEDGNSMFLRKAGIYLQVHTALQTRRPTLESCCNVKYVFEIEGLWHISGLKKRTKGQQNVITKAK
jgi:hypothetical protein